jgi:hypothetical protein
MGYANEAENLMQLDEKTFLVNSPVSLAAFVSFVAKLFADKKYLTFTWRIGEDRSLDQNSLLHVWLTIYAAFLLHKDRRAVTEAELEGIKKIAKRRFYAETGASWVVIQPIDPFTGEVLNPILRSSKHYTREEMFHFLTWLQMTAAGDGLVLESKGQYAKLQREHEGRAA